MGLSHTEAHAFSHALNIPDPRVLDPDEREALLDALRRVETFADIPDADLVWLLERSEVVSRAAGEVHRAEGEPAEHVFVLLEGEVRITQHTGGREVVLVTYGPYALFGELPVLMGIPHYFASGRALTAARVLEIPADVFWEFISDCPVVTKRVVNQMGRRVQAVESVAQERERLVSLGTLAAGLAHELNNPASAARRATADLEEALAELEARARAVGRCMDDARLQALAADAEGGCAPDGALERADAEDACAAWLERMRLEGAWRLAPALVDAGLTAERLDALVATVPDDALEGCLRWLEVRARVRSLARSARDSAARVAALVETVKGYTALDRAPVLEVDVREALEGTLAVLGARLAGAVVERDYEAGLPPVRAYAGALNQVWTVLLENAADALAVRGGHVRVAAAREGDYVRVEVEDDGPGIPPEAQAHVLDPFFTTKEPGRGTGLGLSSAFRTVAEHGGTLRFQSQPGRTVFEVRLPFDSPLSLG
jgi:signal transduction histidine kinase